MHSQYRIGFACKIYTGAKSSEAPYNFNTTTVKYIKDKDLAIRTDILHKLALGNIDKLYTLLKLVGSYDLNRRMVRIGSDLFPLYTHILAHDAYADYDFINIISKKLKVVGDYARTNQIRLSMHPGQFTVLGSLNQNVVHASIQELEYHTEIFNWLGYSGWHPEGIAINIHGGSGKVPLAVFIDNVNKCSSECRNFITVENDEFSFDLNDLCTVSEHIAIVPDLHHEWIHNGHYLDANDQLVKTVIDSWRGVRPKLHCAMSREELLIPTYPVDEKPDLSVLLNAGFNRKDLRAHSDDSWNTALIEYYSTFLKAFDIMCEMKHKQKGSETFYKYILTNGIDI